MPPMYPGLGRFIYIVPGNQPICVDTDEGGLYLVEVTDKKENEFVTIAYTALKPTVISEVSPASVPLSADDIEKLRKLGLLDINAQASPASSGQPPQHPAPTALTSLPRESFSLISTNPMVPLRRCST